MFETPLPEIPKELWDENTVDMYWEVNFVGYPHFNYRVSLLRKIEFVRPAWVRTWKETNPKKRWWNSQPEFVEKTEEFPEELVKDCREAGSEFLSNCLDFTAVDVYNGALNILSGLGMKQKSRNLLGKYPPKTLDIDPSEL